MRLSNVVPDIISLSSGMAGCELAARWDLAIALLEEARAASLELTLVAFSSATSACARGRKWQWALSLLEAARPHLDVVIFCAALSACGRAGQWQWSLHLLQQMRASDLEPDKVTCAAAVAACQDANQPRHTLKLLYGTSQRILSWIWQLRKDAALVLGDRLCGRAKALSATPIVLQVTSPRLITLTLVDLPGVARVPVGDQPEDIELQIRQLILSHIQNPQCLILAVAAANADLATADSLALAREARGLMPLNTLDYSAES
ncbi:unnamed protein product [Effrenium voratum]|nr:unnamed protein product [Effrenium voratum]